MTCVIFGVMPIVNQSSNLASTCILIYYLPYGYDNFDVI